MSAEEQSVFDDHFLDTVREWFRATSDIFVVARYSATAGRREYYWFKDFAKFRIQLANFPPQTDVIEFRDNQFPLRGKVDYALIQQAIEMIPDNTEAMVVNQVDPPDGHVYIWYCDNHDELKEVLQDLEGESAAIGLYATWHLQDSEAMISALVPLPDGTLKRGIY